jgi:hypothetical protein
MAVLTVSLVQLGVIDDFDDRVDRLDRPIHLEVAPAPWSARTHPPPLRIFAQESRTHPMKNLRCPAMFVYINALILWKLRDGDSFLNCKPLQDT